MSSQNFAVHDKRNFVVDYDYRADLLTNCRVSMSQLHLQNVFENWMKESPKLFHYSFVWCSDYFNNVHILPEIC
jgi:hypothetical protein